MKNLKKNKMYKESFGLALISDWSNVDFSWISVSSHAHFYEDEDCQMRNGLIIKLFGMGIFIGKLRDYYVK